MLEYEGFDQHEKTMHSIIDIETWKIVLHVFGEGKREGPPSTHKLEHNVKLRKVMKSEIFTFTLTEAKNRHICALPTTIHRSRMFGKPGSVNRVLIWYICVHVVLFVRGFMGRGGQV